MHCEIPLCLHHSVVLGKINVGLYTVNEDIDIIQNSTTESALLAHSNFAKLWHLRLRDLPFNKLHLVHPNIPSSIQCDSICQVCHKARQTRLPFPTSLSHTTRCFKIVHVDSWGYIRIKLMMALLGS